jgi:hypothetical protein
MSGFLQEDATKKKFTFTGEWGILQVRNMRKAVDNERKSPSLSFRTHLQ